MAKVNWSAGIEGVASFFLYALVLLYCFGSDSLRDFRGVISLDVSCGSGDGSPSLATTDADCESAKQE